VESGKEEIPFSIFQGSGFHLSRACGRGWKNIYESIRTGNPIILNQEEKPGKAASKARGYVLNRLKTGMDWRKQVEGVMEIPPDVRGLGAIESNEDKLFSNRMKKRGMSWNILGSQKMGKGIQLSYNGEWKPWCGRNKPKPVLEKKFVSFDLFDEPYRNVSFPALEGSHASRPWAKVIRDLVSSNPLFN
jgi:hypothetical protein